MLLSRINIGFNMDSNLTPFTRFLNRTIKLLLIILALVCTTFFYEMKQRDLSFGEVFNKQELDSVLFTFKTLVKELSL